MSDSANPSSHPHHAHTQKKKRAPHQAPAPVGKSPAAVRRGTGFWLAMLCYLVLFFFVTRLLHSPVFWLLVLGVIPALTGFVTGRKQILVSPKQSFSAGMRAAGWPVFYFCAINMMIAHYRVGGSPSPAATFLAGFIAAVVYGLLAGAVSGFVSVLLSRQQAQSGEIA